MDYSTHKKLGFITYPTPFQGMKNLRKTIQVKPRIFFKRDDLTEVGLGGNKNRKLDYVMYEAFSRGADTIITWAGVQSNHCRQTLAYAKMLGMECHLVLNGEPSDPPQGNLLVFELFGAVLHFEPDERKCPVACVELCEQLERQGKTPFIVPIGASTPLGSLGYIDCAREIAEQAKAANITVNHIFVASGSGGTQAGLEVGARLYLKECSVHGISVGRNREDQSRLVGDQCRKLVNFIGADIGISDEEIIIHDEYYGDGYAIPSQAGNEAIRLVGYTQAVLLDPVYTGKAMSGMLDILKNSAVDGANAVVFIHSGGGPSVYNFNSSLK